MCKKGHLNICKEATSIFARRPLKYLQEGHLNICNEGHLNICNEGHLSICKEAT